MYIGFPDVVYWLPWWGLKTRSEINWKLFSISPPCNVSNVQLSTHLGSCLLLCFPWALTPWHQWGSFFAQPDHKASFQVPLIDWISENPKSFQVGSKLSCQVAVFQIWPSCSASDWLAGWSVVVSQKQFKLAYHCILYTPQTFANVRAAVHSTRVEASFQVSALQNIL